MRKQMQEVLLHVTNIEELLQSKIKGKMEINERFKAMFPLTSEDDLKGLNNTLNGDPKLVDDLVSYFNGIGGSGPKDHHARIFKTILSNDLGIKCSWKGQRGNIRLENSKLIETCMIVLKQTWRTTNKEFEVFSQEWLRHCPQRKKREEAIREKH